MAYILGVDIGTSGTKTVLFDENGARCCVAYPNGASDAVIALAERLRDDFKEITGAEIPDAPAVRDGNFITGRGPGAAMDFALLLAEALCGAECAAQLAAGMVYTK